MAELFAHESGVLAAAIAGIVIGSLDIPHKEEVEEFKGDLASIAISAVFILLAASLRLNDLAAIGWRGILLVDFINGRRSPDSRFSFDFRFGIKTQRKTFHFIFRTARNCRGFRRHIFCALNCRNYGYTEDKILVSMVFAVVLGTVLIEGTAAGWLARFFRVMPRLTLIIGADETARILAEKLVEAGKTVSIIDTNEENCAEAQIIKRRKRFLR